MTMNWKKSITEIYKNDKEERKHRNELSPDLWRKHDTLLAFVTMTVEPI